MPSIYLSPSTQEYNKYYDGSGSEAHYMKIIADYMETYLTAGNIAYIRNKPKMTAGSSAAHSNEAEHDLHLSIHSNTADMGNAGNSRGVLIYYLDGSEKGKHAAEIFLRNFKCIYPNSELISVVSNSSYAELNRTKAPALLIGIGFHDNPSDAEWIKNNLQPIAGNLALSVTEFLDVSVSVPQEEMPKSVEIPKNMEILQKQDLPVTVKPTMNKGTVNTGGRKLNLRTQPSVKGHIIGQIPDKSVLTVYERSGDWCSIKFNSISGYVAFEYIRIEN